MVDRVALEMRSTRKCTGGSNPSLSANLPFASILTILQNVKNTYIKQAFLTLRSSQPCAIVRQQP